MTAHMTMRCGFGLALLQRDNNVRLQNATYPFRQAPILRHVRNRPKQGAVSRFQQHGLGLILNLAQRLPPVSCLLSFNQQVRNTAAQPFVAPLHVPFVQHEKTRKKPTRFAITRM